MLWPGPSFGFAGAFKSSASFALSFPFFPAERFVSFAGFFLAGLAALGFAGTFAFFAFFSGLAFFTIAFTADFAAGALAIFFPLLLWVFFAALTDLETAFLIFFGISTEEF
jgi:hypothetical protein